MQRCECHSSPCQPAACVPPFIYGGAYSRAGLLHRGGRAHRLRTGGPGKLQYAWALIGGAYMSTCLPPFTVANRFWSDINPEAALRGWYEARVLTTPRRWAATRGCCVASAAERPGGRPRAGPRNVFGAGAPVGWHEGGTDPTMLGSRAEVLRCACCRVLRRPPACGGTDCLRVRGHRILLLQVPRWGGTREKPTPPRWAAAPRCCVARAAASRGGRPSAGPWSVFAAGAPAGWQEGATNPTTLGGRAGVLRCACRRAPGRPPVCAATEWEGGSPVARHANVRPVVPVPGRRLVRGATDEWTPALGVSATTLRQRAGGPWHAGQAYSALGALSFAAPAMP